MRDLNAEASEYKPNTNAATVLENDLVLNWYPIRMIAPFGQADDLLELGLGHGLTAGLFAAACKRHVIIDSTAVVIDQFRQSHPSFKSELVQDYFENFTCDQPFDVIVRGLCLSMWTIRTRSWRVTGAF